jgi:hypothetical protein
MLELTVGDRVRSREGITGTVMRREHDFEHPGRSSLGTMASKAKFGRTEIQIWRNAYSVSRKRTAAQVETSLSAH